MKLSYHQYGSGYPLVILHALFDAGDNWRGIGHRLGENYQVWTPDLRNHGRSPHSHIFNYKILAQDVLEFTIRHQLKSIFLLGHSMGGKIAMQLTQTHPSLIKKLMVVDIAPRAYQQTYQTVLFDAMFAVASRSITELGEADRLLKEKRIPKRLRGFLLKNLRADHSGFYKWRIYLDALHQNFDRITANIEMDQKFDNPALFIKGEKSDYISEEDPIEIKKTFQKATCTTINGVGHWIHAEAPAEFTQIALTFFGEI
ncbi:MAG: hypothetical protein B6244_12915 [Candidatus Cloacimonetes bacterium 4572_55]|nr:MAG: hypothetical protein B6244_12915 [Candidatus Cloacimonetes bacterium 4572_55]